MNSTTRHCHVCAEPLPETRLRLCGRKSCRDAYEHANNPIPDTKWETLAAGGKRARTFMPH